MCLKYFTRHNYGKLGKLVREINKKQPDKYGYIQALSDDNDERKAPASTGRNFQGRLACGTGPVNVGFLPLCNQGCLVTHPSLAGPIPSVLISSTIIWQY